MQEAEENKDDIIALMETWTIAKLKGQWKISGPGYGSKIEPILGVEGIDEQVLTRMTQSGIIHYSLLTQTYLSIIIIN